MSSTTTTSTSTSLSHVLSYDGNIMLAAIIALLLVILFVLLLHVYAKWFLSTPQIHRNPNSSISVSHVRFHSFTIDSTLSSLPSKGLDSSVIASLPLFTYKKDDYKANFETECVVCLSVFEENEVGRKLPNCGHVFHVECINMWLHSHLTCPICRDPVTNEDNDKISEKVNRDELADRVSVSGETLLEIVLQVPNSEDESVDTSSSLSSQPAVLTSSIKRSLNIYVS